MNRICTYVWILTLAAALAACGSATSPPQLAGIEPAPTNTTSADEPSDDHSTAADPGLNLLVSASGDVQLKRREWADYYRTDFGSQLHRGDLVQIVGNGSAVVLCDGLQTWQVPIGSPAGLNNGCPPPQEKILVRGGIFLGNTRGGSDPLIPYIISPRKTKLLDTTPMLRWNPVPGATSYTVMLTGEGVDWQTTVTDAFVEYPGEPPLARGESYSFVVVADTDTGESSVDEGVQGIGFTTLDTDAAVEVEENIERIMQLELEAEAKDLALSQYLVGEELISEAIETLEKVVDEMPESPFPYRMLGDLYRQSGLNLLAQEKYETAMAIADENDNLEAGAWAREGLAEVALSLGEREQAATSLQEAIELFEQLGDIEQVDALTEQLEANGL